MRAPRINRGEVIKARFLNDLASGVDEANEKAIKPPSQLNAPPDPEVQNEDADSTPAETYVETGRTTSLVQVFDQNDENYAEITRVETISFTNGLGETLSLQFNNS